MKKGSILFILFNMPYMAVAQEMWGISNSNFSGNMGMGLNPASMVAAPYYWELNVLSTDLFVQNNYIYLRKGNFSSSDYYTTPDKLGYAHINAKGPSFILNRGNYSIGLHTAFRSGLSAKGVPYHFAKFMYEGFDYEPQHGIHYTGGPFSAAMLEWVETGISAGGVLKETGNNLFTGAITLNYLTALNAVFLKVNTIDYIVPNAMLLIVNNMDGTYGHTGFDGDGNIPGQLFSKKGSGFSGDIGFQYYHNRLERAYSCDKRSDDFKKYKYKVGISAVDVGFVQIKKNAQVFSYQNASTVWPGIDTVKFENLADFDTSLSNQFTGDPYASQTGNRFDITMPAAASIQFDFCVRPRWYINATIIQRIPVGQTRILRPNQVSITPRYETRNFEVALPVSSYDYALPRIGLAIRYRFFVIGTDKLGAFTGLWDVSGIDLYIGIKLQACSAKSKRVRGEDCFAY